MTGPWTFEQAHAACQKASRMQADAEDALRDAVKTAAHAEEAYRLAVAKEILRQHNDDGVAWTVAPDLARGEKTVARLQRERSIAEGMRDATAQLAWRRAADRKDAQRFSDWSQRRELAENGAPAQSGPDLPVIGGRRAAA